MYNGLNKADWRLHQLRTNDAASKKYLPVYTVYPGSVLYTEPDPAVASIYHAVFVFLVYTMVAIFDHKI